MPEHWCSFGERHSPLTTSPRRAATPAGAILNYLYALAEFECRLALLAVGLDPGTDPLTRMTRSLRVPGRRGADIGVGT